MDVAPRPSASTLLIAAALLLIATGAHAFTADGDRPGRWKWSGSECYWEPNDDGPDQCDPNAPRGRYKLNPGGCYWEPNDSGPDQCSPYSGRWKWSGSQCYWDWYDNGPQQCDPSNPPGPPSVNLTGPSGGANYISPASVSMSAQASTSQGWISYVQFYANSSLLATVTQAPYSYVWSGVGTGSYTISALAVNNYGLASWSSATAITVSANAPPSVALTSPASGATLTAPAAISLSASASDADGSIARVDFYAGGTLIVSDTIAPYSYTWSGVGTGSYSITARAVDNLGASTTSAAVAVSVAAPPNVPPSIFLTAPANGATFGAPASITISANASDADGSIATVAFYAGAALLATDTTAPYSCVWSAPPGSYSLWARATDNSGLYTDSGITTISVQTNTPPIVSITSPASGASSPASWTLGVTATASDADGTVTAVDFYANGTLIGTDATAPYGIDWFVDWNQAGSYVLTAAARDETGVTSISAGVLVTITAPTGRLKWSGDKCYWEPNDSGIDQCIPPPTVYVNGTAPLQPVVVRAGQAVLVQVSYTPGHVEDWVGLFAVQEPDVRSAAADWKYLNGEQFLPALAVDPASLILMAPLNGGVYEVRLFDHNQTRLATSGEISVWMIRTASHCETVWACVKSRYGGRESETCTPHEVCYWYDPPPQPPDCLRDCTPPDPPPPEPAPECSPHAGECSCYVEEQFRARGTIPYRFAGDLTTEGVQEEFRLAAIEWSTEFAALGSTVNLVRADTTAEAWVVMVTYDAPLWAAAYPNPDGGSGKPLGFVLIHPDSLAQNLAWFKRLLRHEQGHVLGFGRTECAKSQSVLAIAQPNEMEGATESLGCGDRFAVRTYAILQCRPR